MSEYAMTFRWVRTVQDRDWPKSKPSQRAIMAVAFIISRYCDKDGSNIECSLNTITTKAGIARRTTIEVLQLLIAEKLLMTDGKARGGVVRYRMILGGSEPVLNSTRSQPALCQKDENSATTNDAARASLTLARSATIKPVEFATMATSSIKPTKPEINDPEILRSEIRQIYANRHVKLAIEHHDAVMEGGDDECSYGFFYERDLEKLLLLSGDELKKAHQSELDSFQNLTDELCTALLQYGHFITIHKDGYFGMSEEISRQFRKMFKNYQRTDDSAKFNDFLELLTVENCETLLNDFFCFASEVICAEYQNRHPQLDPTLYDTNSDLWYEGFRLDIQLDTDQITFVSYKRDLNNYKQTESFWSTHA